MDKGNENKQAIKWANNAILGIKSLTLFRPITLSGGKAGLHVSNLEDWSMYFFKEKEAYLFLLLDGVINVAGVIRKCQRISSIKDPKFPRLATKFLKDLVKANVISEVPKTTKKDLRASDMKVFLKSLIKTSKKGASNKNLKRPYKLKISNEDFKKLHHVKKEVSKLYKGKIQIKLQRVAPALASGQVQILSSIVSFGRQKGEIGFGAALSIEGAAMAAIGEAIERTFVFEGKSDIESKSYKELVKSNRMALDPKTFQVHESTRGLPRFSRESKTNWSFFEDSLKANKKILLPSVLNGVSRVQTYYPMPFELVGSGCAVDRNQDNAKLKATLELIERDGVLFYWRTKNVPARIDLTHAPSRIGSLLDALGPLKKKITFFYLKSEFMPITVQATFRGDQAQGEPRFVSTSATRLNSADAIEKALVEMLFVLQGFKESQESGHRISFGKVFDNTVWDFVDRIGFYGFNPFQEAYKFLFPKNPLEIPFADIPWAETSDPQKNLNALILDFHLNKVRLYFRNNTPKIMQDAGFWLYRAFSPDLILLDAHHKFRALGHPRYYQLPKVLGLKRRPKDPGQLNSWPHPLP